MTTQPDHDNNHSGNTGKAADSNMSAKAAKSLKKVQRDRAHKRLRRRVNPHDLMAQTINDVGDSGLRKVVEECFRATEIRQTLTTLPSERPQKIVYPIEQLRRAASYPWSLEVVRPHEAEVLKVCTLLLGCQDLLGGTASASEQLRAIARPALCKLGSGQSKLLRQLMGWGNFDEQDHDHCLAMRALMRRGLQASCRSAQPGPTGNLGGHAGMGY